MSDHDHKGYSEEKCIRCGWVMGHRALNCMNDDTPHVFPSQARTPSFTDDEMEAIRRFMFNELVPQSWRTIDERNDRLRARLNVRFGPNVATWVLGDPSPAPADIGYDPDDVGEQWPSPAPCETCAGKGWIAEDHSWGQPHGEQHQCPSCGGEE